jgi:hypothetical protein
VTAGARGALAALAIVAAGQAAACTSRVGTGIIVEVDALPTVKARIDSVRVQVWNGDARPVVDEIFAVADGPVPKLPVRLGLRPAEPQRASTLRIEATGLHGVDRQQRARAGSTVTFRPSELMHVQLLLGAVCPSGCAPEQTCGAAGLCLPVGSARPPADAGPDPTTDGGAGADASPPADAQGPADAGDAGSSDRTRAPPAPSAAPDPGTGARAPPAPHPSPRQTAGRGRTIATGLIQVVIAPRRSSATARPPLAGARADPSPCSVSPRTASPPRTNRRANVTS